MHIRIAKRDPAGSGSGRFKEVPGQKTELCDTVEVTRSQITPTHS